MADAFVYMFVIGSGFSLGVAVIVFMSWKVLNRLKNKAKKKGKRKHGAI